VTSRGAPELDEQDIRAFLRTDYRRVVVGVSLVSGSIPAAEDAVQEALARAWERTRRGERIDSLPGWVTTVAMNLVKTGWRTRMRERRALSRLDDLEGRRGVQEILDRSGEMMDLRRSLATLSPRQRQVTILRYWLDLDVGEIAGLLGVDQGTVKTLLFRARRKLAGVLGEQEPEDSAQESDR
jgi:RNA polymerase sigma-70 factor (ECF subfamily)